jgi:hypothetical protein
MKGLTLSQKEFERKTSPLHIYRLQDAVAISGMSYHKVQKTNKILIKKGFRIKWQEDYFGAPRHFYNSTGNPRNLEHEIKCTQSLLKFLRSEPKAIPLSEEYLWRFMWGLVPDFGLKFQSKFLLVEYCTANNIEHGEVVKKINKYQQTLDRIEHDLEGEVTCVYLLDCAPAIADALARHDRLGGRSVFAALSDFDRAADVLRSSIYYFSDGTKNPLRQDVALDYGPEAH